MLYHVYDHHVYVYNVTSFLFGSLSTKLLPAARFEPGSSRVGKRVTTSGNTLAYGA